MNIRRKINRNKLKNAQQNNKINNNWREYQISKYGINKWCKIYNDSQKVKNKANKATKGTAFYV